MSLVSRASSSPVLYIVEICQTSIGSRLPALHVDYSYGDRFGRPSVFQTASRTSGHCLHRFHPQFLGLPPRKDYFQFMAFPTPVSGLTRLFSTVSAISYFAALVFLFGKAASACLRPLYKPSRNAAALLRPRFGFFYIAFVLQKKTRRARGYPFLFFSLPETFSSISVCPTFATLWIFSMFEAILVNFHLA